MSTPLDSVLQRLNDYSIFGGITAEELTKVEDLFHAGSYASGSRIIEEGGQGNRFYIVTAGRVEVSIRCTPPNRESQESILAILTRGSTFGEMELIDTQNRSASVTAIEPTETVELTNMGLYEIFLREPEVFRMVIMNLARDLSRRLRVANRQLASVQLGGNPS